MNRIYIWVLVCQYTLFHMNKINILIIIGLNIKNHH
jgi:hypothetical protein